MEHRWFGDDSYSSFCPLEANTTIYPSATCVAPQMSVAAMFYPYSDVSSGACPLLADSTVAAVRGAIYSALTTTQVKKKCMGTERGLKSTTKHAAPLLV